MSDDAPSLEKTIDVGIITRLTEMNTCLPGKVTAVDVAKGKCSVQCLIKIKYGDGTLKDRPVITGVPIAMYRAGTAFVALPVKVGHYVEVRFSQRSLDQWLNKGGSVDPLDPRKFHIKDAIAYPGLYPFSDPPVGASADDIVIQNTAKSRITIKPDGTIQIEGSTAIKHLADLVVLSGDSDAIALASKVKSELQAIHTWASAHTHPYVNVASSAITSPSAAPVLSPVGEVKSLKVKAE